MKKAFVIIASALLICSLAISVFAYSYQRDITVYYNGIRIKVDGVDIVPKDANGEIIDPFISEGTTYLPVRAVAEAVGYNVEWDDKNKTVILDKNYSDVVIDPGMYIVGKDIPAGLYKLVTIHDDTAYWERDKDALGNFNSIIANDNFENTTYVEVKDGEYFYLSQCKGYFQKDDEK